MTGGNRRLGPAGLVAITRCGHWRPYQVRLSIDRMRDLADLHLGMACKHCLADWHAAVTVPAREASASAN